jgi:hypothetical protein
MKEVAMRALWTCLGFVVMIAAAAPALPETAQKPKKGDPNEVVCEKIEVIGTRLGAKRVCGTRAEWAEKRKLDREAVDQAQRSANGPCNATLTHTGAPAC